MKKNRLFTVLSMAILAVGVAVALCSCGHSDKSEGTEDICYYDDDYEYFEEFKAKVKRMTVDELRQTLAYCEQVVERREQEISSGELNPEECHEAVLSCNLISRKIDIIKNELDSRK